MGVGFYLLPEQLVTLNLLFSKVVVSSLTVPTTMRVLFTCRGSKWLADSVFVSFSSVLDVVFFLLMMFFWVAFVLVYFAAIAHMLYRWPLHELTPVYI